MIGQGERQTFEIGPRDRLRFDFSESAASHLVAVDPRVGELLVWPVDCVDAVIATWRARAVPAWATLSLNVIVADADGLAGALQNARELLESCAPVLIAVYDEDDAELLAGQLRADLAQLGALRGSH